TPPPAPEPIGPLMEGFDPDDLRSPFDSILPATLDTQLDDLTPPAPFDLVNGRPSSLSWAPERHASRVPYLAALAGLPLGSPFVVRRIRPPGPRAGEARPPTWPSAEAYRPSMTPAQAASWASAPFTVDLPDETSANRALQVPPTVRDPAPPPLPHF